MNTITELLNCSMTGGIGMLSVFVSVIVEILKKKIPQKIPTQLVTIFVSLLVVFGTLVFDEEVTISKCVMSIYTSFIVSFISMFGFDTFKELVQKCGGNK